MMTPIISVLRISLLSGGLFAPFIALAGDPGPSSMKGPDAELFGEKIMSEFNLDGNSKIHGIQLSIPMAVIEKALNQPMTDLTIELPDSLQGDSLVQHITLNWNPHGHEPSHVYDRPHFDFHFYFLDKDKVDAIDCSDRTPIPAEIVPKDYVLPPLDAPTACVPAMGIHALPKQDLSPDFEFTQTPIYGYYQGKLIFFEPMITRDFLMTGKPVEQKIEYPAAFLTDLKTHFIPNRFTMMFDEEAQMYRLNLGY